MTPTENSIDRARLPDVTQLPLANLEKYAGWLAKGSASGRVRGSVKALGVTIAARGDVVGSVQTLEADIDRLGSGGIAKLLRSAVRELRAALDTATV